MKGRKKRKCKELKRDITEIQSGEDSIEKGTIWKILNKKQIIKNRTMRKILNQKETMKKNYEENPEPNSEYEKNPQPNQGNHKKMHKKNKKSLNKVETFCQKIRQGPYFILHSVTL